MWFEDLTGFREESPQQVRAILYLEGQALRSRVNDRSFICGKLETPTLAELRNRVMGSALPSGQLTVQEVIANVQELHLDPAHAGALFQVASQFNLLEMVSPNKTPEHGLGIYELDHTQGPACAIAAGAGTIYRNYFAEVNGEIGQSSKNQIDTLEDLGEAMGNRNERLWKMKNGYALVSEDGLKEVNDLLKSASGQEREALKNQLRIGLQWNTQVTLGGCQHTVSQAYCSALPVAYNDHPPELWTEFARLVLEASYEATICAAALNSANGGSNKLFLTLLGGGAFGNRGDWILESLHRALWLFRKTDLDVSIVSYKSSEPLVQELIRRMVIGQT
jgi:hypothetical protein